MKAKHFLVVILLLSVSIGTYANSLFYDFVFDDNSLVVDNPYVKNPSYISKAFQKDLWDFSYEQEKPNYYRPLQTLSFMLDYKLWGLNSFGYHLTNILLHFLNGLLVLGILYLLFNNFFIAVCSSFIFCVHPVNSSTVSYISGRGDLLGAAFVLLALLFSVLSFKTPRNKKTYFAFVILFSISAFLSRESSLVVPFGLVLALYFVKGNNRNKILLLASVILSALLYLYFRSVVLNIPLTKQAFLPLSLLLRIINFLYLIILYVFLLAVPVNLYLAHTIVPVSSWLDPKMGITWILFIVGLITWSVKRHNKILNFSLTWFLVFVSPVFLVMTGFSRDKLCMAENWIYLAAIGFYVAVSCLLYLLWSRHKLIAYCLIAIMFLTYATAAISANFNFKDRIGLAGRMLLSDPENKEAHKELASAYLRKRKYIEASEHIDQAKRLGPLDPDLYLLRGSYLEGIGDIDSAAATYEELLKIQPNSSRADNNLGAIYFDKAEFNKAKTFFERAIKLNPLLAEPYLNMAKLSQRDNNTTEAALFYEQAIKLNPDLEEAFINLARIYLDKRDYNSAISVLEKAFNSGHRGEPVLMLLGIANGALGFDAQAGYYFSELLKLGPKSQEAMLNLGIFYANHGQLNKAVEIWEKSLSNAPDNKIIKENIEKAQQLLSQGR